MVKKQLKLYVVHLFITLVIRDLLLTIPPLSLSHSKLFHVRPVTHTDVYRADAKEIPRIFQVMSSDTSCPRLFRFPPPACRYESCSQFNCLPQEVNFLFLFLSPDPVCQ